MYPRERCVKIHVQLEFKGKKQKVKWVGVA